MKIIAVGMNYALHNQELGHTSVNKEPVIFMKSDSAILKDVLSQTVDAYYKLRLIMYFIRKIGDKERFAIFQNSRIGLHENNRLQSFCLFCRYRHLCSGRPLQRYPVSEFQSDD